jgi:uncharacterized membrane protein YphA (DoxX/SURF4 family)
MLKNRTILFLFRLLVGGVFLWAGILKIIDPLGFIQSIENYHVFPRSFSFFTGLTLPWLEVFCGSLLIVGVWKRATSLFLSLLLFSFLVLIILTIFRGINIDCGCFGSLDRKVDVTLILVDVILLGLGGIIFIHESSKVLDDS